MATPIFTLHNILGEDINSDISDIMEEETEINQNEHEVEQEVQNKETNTKHNSKRSWVWSHFTYDETVKKARCNYCRILITCNKGSTSGMAVHAKTKHKITKSQEKNKQLTLHESINNSLEVIVCII